jgi:hypothetical protein
MEVGQAAEGLGTVSESRRVAQKINITGSYMSLSIPTFHFLGRAPEYRGTIGGRAGKDDQFRRASTFRVEMISLTSTHPHFTGLALASGHYTPTRFWSFL